MVQLTRSIGRSTLLSRDRNLLPRDGNLPLSAILTLETQTKKTIMRI